MCEGSVIGTAEIALQLKVIGRIGEDEIDALGRELCKLRNAVAANDLGGRTRHEIDAGRPNGRPATRHNHDSEL